MKSRILLVLVLFAALLICGCGSPETVKEQQAETPVAGENEPTAAPEAGNEQQTEPPAADETEPTAAPEADYTGMTLEQIKALDAVDRDALMQYVLSRQDLPMEEIVASGLFDTEGLFEIIVERFPAMTIEEVMALDVFDPDAIGVLNMIRQDIISQNGGVDPAVPVEEPIDGVVVSLTLGTVSHETGYAVQGGDTLSTEEGSSLELALGGDNYIQLHANTQVTVHRQGEELRLEMSQGGLSFFFADAEQMVCSPVCVSSLCTIDMQSRCGFINRPAGALWIKVTPYAGQMTLRLNDGSTGIAADGVTTTVLRENEVDAGEAFSGKFEGMTDLILNHRQIADVLASAYEMSTAEVLLTAGIRTEPEIRIRDLGNGTYDRTVIDVNGDVVEDGRFNSADDSVLSNYLYQYDENHRVIREELIAPGNYWDGRVNTYTYYDTGEVKTDSYTMPDGRFENRTYDKHENTILMESGTDGVVDTHQESEYNDADVCIHERTVGTDFIAESRYDDEGRTLRYVRTDLEGNPKEIHEYTYYENGQMASERYEYYRDMEWYEAAYDESGNKISEEKGKLE